MLAEVVFKAIDQSRTREPLVNAMALLTGARVLAYMDLRAAKRAFEEGISVFEQLGLDAHTAQFLGDEIIQIAVPVDPEMAAAIYRQMDRTHTLPHFDGRALIFGLAIHRFNAIALNLLEDLRYPVEGAESIIQGDQDPAFKLRVLRAAKARWHLPRHSPMPDDFHRLFSRHFRALDPDEATVWLDELLLRAKTLKNDRISAGFGGVVQLETFADMHIFALLNALRVLKPQAFVESVLSQYPAVAAAAKDFPNGTESIFQAPTKAVSAPAGGFSLLNPSISISHLLDEAHHIFIEDVNSNSAPRPFWPSVHAYKQALYWAGERYGAGGSQHLEAVPDKDIAILAAVEFAAGILGIPMRGGFQRRSPSLSSKIGRSWIPP